MSMSKERLITTLPGHWQSQAAQRARAHPLCTLQQFHPEDLEQTMCDALTDEEKSLQAHTDAATFRLHQQFMRAHGMPKGELTTLVTTLAEGGVFLSRAERHQ